MLCLEVGQYFKELSAFNSLMTQIHVSAMAMCPQRGLKNNLSIPQQASTRLWLLHNYETLKNLPFFHRATTDT